MPHQLKHLKISPFCPLKWAFHDLEGVIYLKLAQLDRVDLRKTTY